MEGECRGPSSDGPSVRRRSKGWREEEEQRERASGVSEGTRRKEGEGTKSTVNIYGLSPAQLGSAREWVSKHMHERYDDRCSRRAREEGSTGESPGARPLGCTLRLRPQSDPECRPWQTTLIKSGSGRSLPPPIRSCARRRRRHRPRHNLKHPVLPLAPLVVVAVVDIVRRVRLSLPFSVSAWVATGIGLGRVPSN